MRRLRELDWDLIRDAAQTVGVLALAVLQTSLFAVNLADPEAPFVEMVLHFVAAIVWISWYSHRVTNRRWK